MATKYEVQRPSADLLARICHARRTFNLSIQQMAVELRIRPEWLSRIVNRHQPVSYNIGLRFDDFLRRQGVDPERFARGTAEISATAARLGPALELRKTIEANVRALVDSAGSDLVRLEQIAQWSAAFLKPPTEPNAQPKLSPARSRPTEPKVAIIEVPRHPDNRSAGGGRERERRDALAERFRVWARERSG